MKFLGVKYTLKIKDNYWWASISDEQEYRYGFSKCVSKDSVLNNIKNQIIDNGSCPIMVTKEFPNGMESFNKRYKPVWNKANPEHCGYDYYLKEYPFIFNIKRNKVIKTKWDFQAYRIENDNHTSYNGSCFKVCDSLKEAKQNVFAAYRYLTYFYKEKS